MLENYHSYTFKVERENPEYRLENLILSYHDSLEVYHAYIQTYEITKEELNAINSEEYVDLEGKINLLSIDGTEIISDFFNKEMITINELCPITTGVCGSGDHTLGNQGDCNIPGTFTYTHTWVDCSWSLDPNEGVPSGGGGGNSGGGGDPPPNDYDGSDPDIHGNGGSIITSPNTGCRGAGCIEIEDPEEEEDKKCEELDKLMATYQGTNPSMNTSVGDLKIRTAITNIDNYLDNNHEKGYGFYNQNNYPLYGPFANHEPHSSDDYVHFPTIGYQFGTLHTHPDDGEGTAMFSLNDINSLINIRNNYQLNGLNPSGDDLFVSVLVVKHGGETHTYAIKIKDANNLQGLSDIKNNDPAKYELMTAKLQQEYTENINGQNVALSSPEAIQIAFLKFANRFTLGVSLYEMKTENEGSPNVSQSWEELTLSNNENDIERNPC